MDVSSGSSEKSYHGYPIKEENLKEVIVETIMVLETTTTPKPTTEEEKNSKASKDTS